MTPGSPVPQLDGQLGPESEDRRTFLGLIRDGVVALTGLKISSLLVSAAEAQTAQASIILPDYARNLPTSIVNMVVRRVESPNFGEEKKKIFLAIIEASGQCSLDEERRKTILLGILDFLNAPNPNADKITELVGFVNATQTRPLQMVFVRAGTGELFNTNYDGVVALAQGKPFLQQIINYSIAYRGDRLAGG